MLRTFKITVDGKPYSVTVEEVSETPSMLIPQPGDMEAASPAPSPEPKVSAAPPTAAAAVAAGSGGEVAPLGGVVVSIDVKVGQQVNEGDKIATIEAMKMKTVVVAHRAGKVTDIAVKPGDGVEAGQVMMTIQ